MTFERIWRSFRWTRGRPKLRPAVGPANRAAEHLRCRGSTVRQHPAGAVALTRGQEEDGQMAIGREVLRTTDLRKTFDADSVPVRALRGVDVTVVEHEFVAVMGPSGCGKSTLLNLVAGLEEPSAGEITVGGTVITGMSESRLARM